MGKKKKNTHLLSKGNQVNIPDSGSGEYKTSGNTNELGDIGGKPGKSYLFFLTASNEMTPESGQLAKGLLIVAGKAPHF